MVRQVFHAGVKKQRVDSTTSKAPNAVAGLRYGKITAAESILL